MPPLYDVARVRAALEEAGATGLMATLPQNVLYLTRFRKAGGALALLTAESVDRPTLLIPAASIDFVLEDPDPAVEIIPYGSFVRFFARDDLPEREATVRRLHQMSRPGSGPAELAISALERAGASSIIADAPVGVIPGFHDGAPGLKVTSDPELFLRLRMVKTPAEVDRLRTSARITEEAIAESVAAVRPGATQGTIARAYAGAVVARGAGIRSDNVSIDEGAALTNVNMPEDTVRPESIIRYDVGAIFQGYASDVARCFSVGAPADRIRSEYDALLLGEQAALDILRPGVRASDLFDAAVAAVRVGGIPDYERTHVGHGIGIAGTYDMPLLAPNDHTVIEPGTVLCVETPYYDVGRVGLQVEDMVLVTDDGFEFLSRSSRRLEAIG